MKTSTLIALAGLAVGLYVLMRGKDDAPTERKHWPEPSLSPQLTLPAPLPAPPAGPSPTEGLQWFQSITGAITGLAGAAGGFLADAVGGGPVPPADMINTAEYGWLSREDYNQISHTLPTILN